MIEMGIRPMDWREQPREDREFLLAMRRNMRRVEGIEYHEGKKDAKPRPGAAAPPTEE